MRGIIALANRHHIAAKLVYSQANDAFGHFFSLNQARIQDNPENKAAIISSMLQEPILIKYIEKKAWQLLRRMYPGMHQRQGDIVNEIVSEALLNLEHNLQKYDPNQRSLEGYVTQAVAFAVYSANNTMRKQTKAPGNKSTLNLDSNKIENDEYGGYDTNPDFIEHLGDTIPDKNGYMEQLNELERLENQLNDLKMYGAQDYTKDKYVPDTMIALKNKIARLKNQIYGSNLNDAEPVNEMSDIYSKHQSDVPTELSEHFYNMIRFPKSNRDKNLPNGLIPTHRFFAQHIQSINPEYQKLISKLMFETMLDLRQSFNQSRHKSDDIKTDRTFGVLNIKEEFQTKLIQKMVQNGIPSDIQEQVLNYTGKQGAAQDASVNREMYYRLMESDELTRFAYYSYYKNMLYKDEDWSQLSDENLLFLATATYQQMDYANNNAMAVRSYDQHRGSKALDYVPRTTKNIPKDVAMEIMLKEVHNLKAQKQGQEMFASLPHGSEYFHKPKTEYTDESVGQTPETAYNGVINDQAMSIQACNETLLVYANWCDKQGLHRNADSVYRTICAANAVIC